MDERQNDFNIYVIHKCITLVWKYLLFGKSTDCILLQDFSIICVLLTVMPKRTTLLELLSFPVVA